MIRHIKHHEIDFDKWDDCINEAYNGIIYPYSWYLSQLSPGWGALVLNDYEAVMPLTVKKKWGIPLVIQPLFAQQLGVFSKTVLSEEYRLQFIKSIPSSYQFVLYNFNTYNTLPEHPSYKRIASKNYELDLIADIRLIRQAYNQNTRRNLKKAQSQKVFVTKNADPDQIIELFKNNKGKHLKVLKEEHYKSLKHLLHSSLRRGNMCAYAAYDRNNQLCAGGVFLHSHNKSILILAAASPEGKNNGAMTRIIDRYIEEYSQTATILDFEGSNNANVARFYKGFGAKKCTYYKIFINNFPPVFKQVFQLYYNNKIEKD